MCMQDLIIDKSVSWRSVDNITRAAVGGVNYAIIPPNPNRFALMPYNVATGATLPVLIRDQSDVMIQTPQITGSAGGGRWVDVRQSPGVFGQPLYVSELAVTAAAYELVYDPALASAVNKGYGQLLAENG